MVVGNATREFSPSTRPDERWGIRVTQATPAGWYPDPENPTQQRYWDGAVWAQNVAPATPSRSAPQDAACPDNSPKPVEAPVLGTWATSAGFSILGVLGGLAAFLIIWQIVALATALFGDLVGLERQFVYPLIAFFTTSVVCTLAIGYAAKFYPSYFGEKPRLSSSKSISLFNFAFGGPVFGALWNRSLTKKTKGSSHVVLIVLLVLWLLGVGGNVAGAWLFTPAPFAFTPSGTAVVSPDQYNAELVLRDNGVSEYYVITIGDYDWRMLAYDQEADAALLVADENIGTARFDDNSNDWQTSEIREFLNGPLLQQLDTDIDAEYIVELDNTGTGSTERVFLLSQEEAEYYFQNNQDATTASDGTKLDSWWLRTPGTPADAVMVVVPGQGIGDRVTRARNDNYGVRPAFWLLIPGEPGAGK